MELTLLQQIQNQVADQWNYERWDTMPIYPQNSLWPQVAEMYARALANEKVKEDREDLISKFGLSEEGTPKEVVCYFPQELTNRPLPFRDEISMKENAIQLEVGKHYQCKCSGTVRIIKSNPRGFFMGNDMKWYKTDGTCTTDSHIGHDLVRQVKST